MGDSGTSGEEEDAIPAELPRAAPDFVVLHQDQASRRLLHLHPRHSVSAALVSHSRHLLAAARVARQNDPR